MSSVAIKYACTILGVALLFAVGILLGRTAVHKFPHLGDQSVRGILSLVGTGLLLVSAIGRLGWSIQTYDGNSPAETLDNAIFWFCSVAGTGLLVFEFALGRFAK